MTNLPARQPHHRKPVRLALVALHAAIAGDWPRATGCVQRINDECGGQSTTEALTIWCDALINHATGSSELPTRVPVEVRLWDETTGQVGDLDAEQAPPHYQWAARLVQARAAMDEAAWAATISELPADGHVVGKHVGAVLAVAAWSIGGPMPKGYAAMGNGQ